MTATSAPIARTHQATHQIVLNPSFGAEYEPPENFVDWELEEKARNFIEAGYSIHGRPRFPKFSGSGERSRIVQSIFGPDEATYEASLRNEFPYEEPSPRVFSKRFVRDGLRGKQNISGSQFVDLYSAVAFANTRGIVMNVHVSITWGLLGIHDHSEAAKVLRYEFLKHLQGWFEYKSPGNQPFVWLYVHEVGRTHGFHTHLLTAIPANIRVEFRKWVAQRLASLSRSGSVPKGAYKIVAPPSDYIGRQWRYLQYFCKGMSGTDELQSSVGTEPYVYTETLVRTPYKSPGNVLCKKRCGVSNNLGAKGRNKAEFKSLLEEGVADVRRLYAGMEYLGYLRNQREMPCDRVTHRLLKRELLVQQIIDDDAENALMQSAERQRRSAKREEDSKAHRAWQREQEEDRRRISLLKI